MWIERQKGYCLKKIAGVQYLLPYGQKIADQKKGIVLNETGVFLWNALNRPMTENELAELLIEQCSADETTSVQIRKDINQFVQELLSLDIVQKHPLFEEDQYAASEAFAGYLNIANLKVALYGSKELFSYRLNAFWKTESENRKTQNMDQKIEVIQQPPKVHLNGSILLRNKELVVSAIEDGYVIVFPSMNSIFEAQMTADGSLVKVYIKRPISDKEKELTQEELFHAIRHFFLLFAQKHGFFALHSASIAYCGRAWLFSGHSGMGKSTHTALWKKQFGTEIINGDLNLIGRDKYGKAVVYGMPWCGTSGIASTVTWPLGGIVLLGRSDTDHFESLTPDQQIVRVMQRMISPTWTKAMLDENLKCAEWIVEKTPVYHLLCTKEPSAAQRMKERIDQDCKRADEIFT